VIGFIIYKLFRACKTIKEIKNGTPTPQNQSAQVNSPNEDPGSVIFTGNPYYGSEEDGPAVQFSPNPYYQ